MMLRFLDISNSKDVINIRSLAKKRGYHPALQGSIKVDSKLVFIWVVSQFCPLGTASNEHCSSISKIKIKVKGRHIGPL